MDTVSYSAMWYIHVAGVKKMDCSDEIEQIAEFINSEYVCRGIQKFDSSTIDFTPVINGEKVDLKKLNVYKVDIFMEDNMIHDEMEDEDFSAIAYVFMYTSNNKTGVYYIDCKHVQCDKHEAATYSHTRFIPILSTAFDVHLLYNSIDCMYKYGYGHKVDKTSLYALFSHDITKYTSEYHSYEHCFDRRGWTYMKNIHKHLCRECPWEYIDYRHENIQYLYDCMM